MTTVRGTSALSLGSAAVALLFTATIAKAVDVTSCGQTVPAGAAPPPDTWGICANP